MRLTLSEARSTISRVLGICTTDSRVADYINEATRRILYEGKWVGTYGRFRICTDGNESDSIITWPRRLETIETVAVNDRPGVVRNQWYEWLDSGPGLLDSESSNGLTLVDRGQFATTSDIVDTGNPKKIKVYSVGAEAAGLELVVQGEDWSGNPIYTSSVPGEEITIAVGGTLSTNQFSRITGVQKPVTTSVVKVYEYDTVTAVERQIAYYDPDETSPWYRRSIIAGLQNMDECEDCVSGRKVEVIGKLRFIPVVNNTDFILIGNLPALKLAVMAIRKEEADLIGEANAYMYGGILPSGVNVIGAVPMLQKELSHHLGDGVVPVIRVQDRAIFGAGGIESL